MNVAAAASLGQTKDEEKHRTESQVKRKARKVKRYCIWRSERVSTLWNPETNTSGSVCRIKAVRDKKSLRDIKENVFACRHFPPNLLSSSVEWSVCGVAPPPQKSQKRFFFASVSNVIQKVRFKPEKVRPYLCLSHRGADRTKPIFGGIAKENARKREKNEHVGSAVQRPKLMPIFLCFPFPRFPVFELESHVPNFDCVPSPDWDFPVRRLFSFVEMRFWPKIQNGPSLPTTTTFTFIPAASLRASSLPRLLCRQI